MALVDPTIALGFRQPEQPNMLNQYAQIAQLQSGQQAQQLNALKMQEAQAAMQERNALRQLDPSSPDYGKQLMRVSPTQGLAYQKNVSEAATAEATRGKTLADTATAKQKLMSQGLRDISTRPSDAQITAYLEDVTDSPLFSPAEKQKAQQNAAMLIGMPFEERKAYLASQGASAAELKPTIQQQNVGGTMRALSFPAYGGAATVVPGSEVAATMTPAQIEQGRRDQQRLGLESQRVALDVQKQAQASDPAFVQKMAQARIAGETAAKDLNVATKVLPQVVSTANQTLSLIDTMIGKRDDKGNLVKGAAPHPGFQATVGASLTPGMRFVPGSDASDFQSYFDQVKGGAFLQAFETLKGGGAITEKEGEKGTAALNRMNLAQSEKEFVTAAREFQNVVRAGVQRAQAKVPGGGGASGEWSVVK
jgi:hypothetical protein